MCIVGDLHHVKGHHVLHPLDILRLQVFRQVGIETEVAAVESGIALCGGKGLVGLLEGVALGIDVVEGEIAVGDDVAHILSHGGPGDAQLVGGLLGTADDGLHIIRVTALAVRLTAGAG